MLTERCHKTHENFVSLLRGPHQPPFPNQNVSKLPDLRRLTLGNPAIRAADPKTMGAPFRHCFHFRQSICPERGEITPKSPPKSQK